MRTKKRKGSLLAIVILAVALPSFACMCFGADIVASPEAGDDAPSPAGNSLDTPGVIPGEPYSSPTGVQISSTAAPSSAPSSTPVRSAAATRTPTQAPSPTRTPIPDEEGPEISLQNSDLVKVHVGEHATVTAKVSDPCGVFGVNVWWKYGGSGETFFWNIDPLVEIESGVYAVELPPYPGGFSSPAVVYYDLEAMDNCGNTTMGEGGEILIME